MSRLRPVINWNIVGGCNYRCSYCVQKHQAGIGGPNDEQLDAALQCLALLPESFEVKISGGEPFMLKRLPDVAVRLAAAGHTVSLLTNLSVPLDTIRNFINSADTALRTFSCSLHLEQTSEADFLARALAVRDLLAPFASATFVVNSVVRPGHIDTLGDTRRRFEASGIKFYPQLMREDGKPVRYGWLDRRRIARHFGDLTQPGEMNRGFSFTGHLCHAGHRYFIITPKGNAYTCYPGKRYGDGYLGNLFDGSFTLRDGPAPCPYAVCPCTVPHNRKIVGPLPDRRY